MDDFDRKTDFDAEGSSLPDLNDVNLRDVDNPALSAALDRIKSRAQTVGASHYTKHSSHSQKHYSTW